MMKYFSDEATSFFPVNHYPIRIHNKVHLTSRFEEVINKINAIDSTKISLPLKNPTNKKQGIYHRFP